LPVGANVGCEDELDGFSADEVGTDVNIEVDANTRVADDEPAWLTEEGGGALELPLLLFALALDP
jgi:hypothetical protein